MKENATIRIPQHYVDLFWKKIDKKNDDECWEWKASTTKDGYGKYSVRYSKNNCKTFRASRIVYYLYYGFIDNNLLVCHKCDNPLCCNPNHLFLGTVTDNQIDCVMKKRNNPAKGERHSKLKNEDVKNIRSLVKNGCSQINVAKKYKVGKNCIWNIIHNNTWKEIQ